MNYEMLIQEFLDILKKELSPNDFEIIKQNIKSVKIKLIEKNSNENANGLYDPTTGIIELLEKGNKEAFFHELLHASSSYYNGNKLELHSGFHHQHIHEGKNIGNGFNEGYTELLVQRYFGSNNSGSYSNELHYVSLIERIIGKENMQSMYFNSDLNGLISELCKYNSLENVLKFMDNMDKFIMLDELKRDKIQTLNDATSFEEYSKWFNELDEYISQTYKELNQFIIESYLNKINGDPDYENKKAELVGIMSTPLSFNFKEYRFDISSLLSEYGKKIV